MDEFVFQITEEMEGERIDRLISMLIDSLSRSFVQKMIKDGQVFVNGTAVKSSYKVYADDEVRFELPPLMDPDILPENIPLDILYEDKDVIVVNKPKGMVVHPAAGHYTGTLVNALMFHCGHELSGINGVMRPGIVHRIDKDTTGSVIACKNDKAHECIAEQLKEHSVTRRYHAICFGVIKEDEGVIDKPIGRHPSDRKRMAVNEKNGKHAVTHFRVLKRFDKYTYVECVLETGRTHQIRVQMASAGYPLAGDAKYGDADWNLELKKKFGIKRQLLHAYRIVFPAECGELKALSGKTFEAEAPFFMIKPYK